MTLEENDGRKIVIFNGNAPRSLEKKLFILEKNGVWSGVGIEFVEAASIKPLPSGDSQDITGQEGASRWAPNIYSDISDWSEEKDSETGNDGDDEEERSSTGVESTGGSGEASDDSVIWSGGQVGK